MARKPKVYAAEIDGLHDWIVAAPNQTEALAALGVNQNLFQQGRAQVAQDAAAIKAALASPGIPLRRLKGGGDAFSPIEGSGADAWAKAAKSAGLKGASKAAKPRPDRAAIAKALAELKAFEARARTQAAALETEAKDLAKRRDRLVRDHEAERAELHQRLEKTRTA